jgi:Gpi18-like mannosyltransferase
VSNYKLISKNLKKNFKNIWANDFAKVLLIFLASRIFIFGISFVADFGFFGLNRNLFEISTIWNKFDVGFYKSIAENGYEVRAYTASKQANWGFMPLYPITVGFFLKLIPLSFFNLASILSNIFSFAGVYILFKTLKERLGENKSQFLVAYLFSAGSFYLSIPYNESLYILLLALVFYFTKKEYFLAASLFTGLAIATRLQSLALLAIPGIAFLQSTKQSWKNKIWKSFIFGAVVAIPLGVFMIYLKQITGNPLAFIQIQSAWENPDPYPFRAFVDLLKLPISFSSVANFLMWIPFWFLLVKNYRKLPINELLFCFGVIIISTSTHHFYGTYRYALALIPVYTILNNEKSWIQQLFLNVQLVATVIYIFAFVGGKFLAV